MKADGCDLTAGLRESTDHKWSGDVDLGDGSLATLYREYTDRRKFIEGFGIGDRQARWTVSYDCDALEKSLNSDLTAISTSTSAVIIFSVLLLINVLTFFQN